MGLQIQVIYYSVFFFCACIHIVNVHTWKYVSHVVA